MTSLFKLLLLSSFNNSNAFNSSPQQHLLNYSPKILFAENPTPRRTFLTKTSLILPSFLSTQPAKADDFELIATRAAAASPFVSHSKDVASLEDASRQSELARQLKEDMRSIYDFDLPVNGKSRAVGDLIGEAKAILVVNIKQDDPLARKNIPELIALVDRFGKNGEFAVIISPTDQGYYEPGEDCVLFQTLLLVCLTRLNRQLLLDTSALIRLKLASEYGYGTNPAAILTDKVNLLGSGALPFWRWLEGSCRTPAGLGKIQVVFFVFWFLPICLFIQFFQNSTQGKL